LPLYKVLLILMLLVLLQACGSGGDDDDDDTGDDDDAGDDDDTSDDDDGVGVPAAPTELIATSVGETQVDLAWTDSSDNEQGFSIQRKEGTKNGDWTTVGSTGPNATSYQDETVECDASYAYRVVAYNSAGESAPSNEASATADHCSIAAPSNLTAIDISGTQIDLAWTDNSHNEALFEIQRREPGQEVWPAIGEVSANKEFFIDLDAVCETTYEYRVRARNDATGGSSEFSNTDESTTGSCVLVAPINLTATDDGTGVINLAWKDISGAEEGYLLQRQIPGTGTFESIADLPRNTESYPDQDLQCDPDTVSYDYRVRAYNSQANSNWSNEANGSAYCPVAAPSALTAIAASTSEIDLTWTNNATNHTGFRIYRNSIEIDTVSGSTGQYNDSGLDCETVYQYHVTAYNQHLESVPSNLASEQTVWCPVAAPTNLTATPVDPESVNLTWEDNSNNETNFDLERREPLGVWAPLATVAADAEVFSDLTADCNVEYEYQVIAYNTHVQSSWSNTDSGHVTGCAIGGECYADDYVKADNVCLICDTDRSLIDWSDNDGATCDDTLWCSGEDTCSGGECTSHQYGPGNPRCPDDTFWCTGEESCDDGKGECVSEYGPLNPRCPDDSFWCTGEESCDDGINQCVSEYGPLNPRCPDDTFWCTGDESCSEGKGECVSEYGPSNPRCPDDTFWCTGEEICDEGLKGCTAQNVPDCADDGTFCNGDEFCNNAISGCDHTGDPCGEIIEACQEPIDFCQPTCVSVQVDNGPLDEDNDGDGFTEIEGDCDDVNNALKPGALEIFDGLDNNCDGTVDEGWDEDCDGYKNEGIGGLDCDDQDYYINPDASDNDQNTVDENCDGKYGDASTGDSDEDGFALSGTEGAVVDCDDSESFTFPGAAPIDDLFACMRDEDEDDYGADDATGTVLPGTDCIDTDELSNLEGLEIAQDGIDQDCSGTDLAPNDSDGVFVAPSGNNGNSGTMAEPMLTLGAATTLADLYGRVVFAAEGDYDESFETSVSIFGGYESVGWTRDIGTHITTINAQDEAAVIVAAGARIAIEGFTINGGSGEFDSYGIKVSGEATIVDNVIDGGSGGTDDLEDTSSYGVYVSGIATVIDCIIDGGQGGLGISRSAGVHVSTTGAATVSDNTISGGSGAMYSYGAWNSRGSLKLIDNDINGGSCGTRSKGVFSDSSDTPDLLIGNTVEGGSGGVNSDGIAVQGSAFLQDNVAFGGSGATYSYGAFIIYSTVTVVNNEFYGGSSPGWGTGLKIQGSTATVINNTIEGGSGGSTSTGVHVHASTANLVNNIILGGTAVTNRWSIYVRGDSVKLINNDLWGEDLDCFIYQYPNASCAVSDFAEINDCAWPSCDEASGNINDDPLFVGSGDYHLTESSPCRDTGIDPFVWYTGGLADYDIDGDQRPYNGLWDIGMDEWIAP
jgi:putative metal-binding protein/fibronectin type III domain protein